MLLIIFDCCKIRSSYHGYNLLSSVVIEGRAILYQLISILFYACVQLSVFSKGHQDVVQGLIVLHKLRNFKGLVSIQPILLLYRIGGLQDDCLAENFYFSDVLILQLEDCLLGRRGKQLNGLKVHGQPHVEGNFQLLLL